MECGKISTRGFDVTYICISRSTKQTVTARIVQNMLKAQVGEIEVALLPVAAPITAICARPTSTSIWVVLELRL
jgi:hypothetical protein